MSQIVLIVAAHPDDEVLGVGATAALHARRGDRVQPVILAEGATSRGADDGAVSRLQTCAFDSARILGTAQPIFLGFPDNRLDQVPLLDVVQRIEPIVRSLRPTMVYTHHGGDLNIDHRIAFEAVMTACRPMPGASVRSVRTFETLSATGWLRGGGPDFSPNLFCGIGATLALKLDALRVYADELRSFPHARSLEAVEALARLRGAEAGLGAAEAFAIVRAIEPE